MALIFKSENVNAEMIKIMQEIQKYVPCTFNEDGTIQDSIEELPFGGDQLTIERAKNCQLAMLDGESK